MKNRAEQLRIRVNRNKNRYAIVPFPVWRGLVAFYCDQGLINLFSLRSFLFLFRFKMASKHLPGEHYTARGHCQQVQLVPAKVIVSKKIVIIDCYFGFHLLLSY